MKAQKMLSQLIVIIILFLGACVPPPSTPEAAPTGVEAEQPTEPQAEPSQTPTEIIPTETPPPKPEKTPISVKVHRDVEYDESRSLLLDVYQPEIEGEVLPTLVLIHGMGSGKDLMVYPAEFFARQGYAVVVYNKGTGAYPREEQDSFCAIAWVHANAETYAFDTTRIIPVGYSRGGALAALLGTVDDPGIFIQDCPHPLPEQDLVRAAVTVAGIFDYVSMIPGASEDGGIYGYFGPPDENMDKISEASPITWVDGSEPPFLLVHGENDSVVDPNQSVAFEARLSEAGVKVKLALMPNLIHEQITTNTKVLFEIKDFLEALFSQ